LADKLHIEKVNEVYNKVKTDDRGIAEELSAYFTFKVPGYQFMPAYRNKFWDGQIRLYNTATQMLYSGLNNYVIMFAKERGYEVEFEYDNSADNYSVAEAKKFVEENGYAESFNRRFATIDDIKVSEILHSNVGDGKLKSVSIFDNVKSTSTRHKRNEFDGIEEVGIEIWLTVAICINLHKLS